MAPKPPKMLAARATALADTERVAAMDTLPALKLTRALIRDLSRLEERTVLAARRDGQSWEAIGRALGCSRQTAHERFTHLERKR